MVLMTTDVKKYTGNLWINVKILVLAELIYIQGSHKIFDISSYQFIMYQCHVLNFCCGVSVWPEEASKP